MQTGRGLEPDAFMFGGTAGDVATVHFFYRSQQAVRFFPGKLLCIHERVQFIPALAQGIGADLITDLTHV